jgi:hypothetical protein
MRKLSGRPNQGKTQTIRARTVDVYLPTEELVEEWKKAAENASMSLSRYVVEVVERHRQGKPEGLIPNWQLEERAAQLEKEFRILCEKYVILDKAFTKQGEDLKHVSQALQKASSSKLDTGLARRIIRVLLAAPEDGWDTTEIAERAGVRLDDDDALARSREIGIFLKEAGLIETDMLSWRWKLGRPPKRRRTGAAGRRAALRRMHRKHA